MPSRVVVFDTHCLLCSRFIQILLRNDKGQLQYTGFDSGFSEEYIPAALRSQPETVIFYDESILKVKSRAVLSILKYTRWPYRWLRFFGILPDFILDPIYDFIARKRYSWFGRSDQCFMPMADQDHKFLD